MFSPPFYILMRCSRTSLSFFALVSLVVLSVFCNNVVATAEVTQKLRRGQFGNITDSLDSLNRALTLQARRDHSSVPTHHSGRVTVHYPISRIPNTHGELIHTAAVYSSDLMRSSTSNGGYKKAFAAQSKEDIWLYEHWFYGMEKGTILESGKNLSNSGSNSSIHKFIVSTRCYSLDLKCFCHITVMLK